MVHAVLQPLISNLRPAFDRDIHSQTNIMAKPNELGIAKKLRHARLNLLVFRVTLQARKQFADHRKLPKLYVLSKQLIKFSRFEQMRRKMIEHFEHFFIGYVTPHVKESMKTKGWCVRHRPLVG